MYKAHGKYVLVEPIERSEEYKKMFAKAGLIAKDPKAQGPPQQGYIRSIGSEVPDDVGFKVGNKVLFKEEHPEGFKLDDTKLIPVEFEQVVAVLLDES